MSTIMPRLKGFRFPREIIAYAVWAYHRFALSTADVEDLLAARGVMVSREAVRQWVNRFGRHFADCIRRERRRPNDKWHMDEVVIMIRGKKHWLWRAITANGDVLDILVQTRRNAKAAKQLEPPHLNWSTVMFRKWRTKNGKKRPKPEENVSKLRQVEVLMGQGMSRLDAIRQIGVVEQTYYRWRKKYGGMGVDQLKELKRLQKENERLRRAVSDLTLDKLILTEATKGNY